MTRSGPHTMSGRCRQAENSGVASRRGRRYGPVSLGPEGGAGGNAYLIEKHTAPRLHYEFRLELDGVLKSWTITHQPTLDPPVCRVAVPAEDQPVDGLGSGRSTLWDDGTWQPVGDARKGLAKGRLAFVIHGRRLCGRWRLVRLTESIGDRHGHNDWLLTKSGNGP
ncbi:MAG: bifunctional non-ous end joining protein LigD [Rhodospirillaceae bacterium]|nr:bifunctional non-ous end joining protein LigD [Rhodospirillaceae bacterium]